MDKNNLIITGSFSYKLTLTGINIIWKKLSRVKGAYGKDDELAPVGNIDTFDLIFTIVLDKNKRRNAYITIDNDELKQDYKYVENALIIDVDPNTFKVKAYNGYDDVDVGRIISQCVKLLSENKKFLKYAELIFKLMVAVI